MTPPREARGTTTGRRTTYGGSMTHREPTSPGTAVDWLLRSRTSGEVVVGQPPNPPILVWTLATGLSWFTTGRLRAALQTAAAVSLAWWSLDELLRGVNPLRRLFGLAGLGWLLESVRRRR